MKAITQSFKLHSDLLCAGPCTSAIPANKLSNNSNPFRLLLFGLSLILCFSCEQKDDTEELGTLQNSFDSLFNERMAAWDSMMVEDDRKIRYMGRMLDEIAYQISYDEVRMNQLRAQIQDLSGLRYRMDELSEIEKIDRYDAATDSVIQGLFYYVTETPQASDLPLVAELMTDIRTMDNFVLQRRNAFDDATMALNELIEKNEKKIRSLGGRYADVEPYPMFLLYPG